MYTNTSAIHKLRLVLPRCIRAYESINVLVHPALFVQHVSAVNDWSFRKCGTVISSTNYIVIKTIEFVLFLFEGACFDEGGDHEGTKGHFTHKTEGP